MHIHMVCDVYLFIYLYTHICDTHVRSYIITHMSKRSAIITICEVPPPMNPSFLNLEPTVQEMHNHSTNVCVTMKELGGAGQGYNGITIVITPGWWCNNHLEKYEFVNGKDNPIMQNNPNVWNHQPAIVITCNNPIISGTAPPGRGYSRCTIKHPNPQPFFCGNFSYHVSGWIFCRVHHITMQWFALFSHILYLWVKNQVF